jgi:hypothetical protein
MKTKKKKRSFFIGMEYCIAYTEEGFEKMVKKMGWENTTHFEKETGVTMEELLNVKFLTMHDRIYIH